MKVIVAGSRGIINRRTVDVAIEAAAHFVDIKIDELVSGNCKRGVDKLGEEWAKDNDIPIKLFPADWTKHPFDAGRVRNCVMRMYADALVAVWDGHSNGTRHMIEQMRLHRKPYFVYNLALNEYTYGNYRKQDQEEGTEAADGVEET